MYTSFTIENFRGFEHLELTDLKRVNLIAGKNNVGKTSLLEAIYVHYGRIDGLLSRLENEKQDWQSLFYESSREIRLTGDKTLLVNGIAYPTLRIRPSKDWDSITAEFGEFHKYELKISSGIYERKDFPIVFITANDKSSLNKKRELFSELRKNRNTNYLNQVMRIIETRLIDLELLDDGIYADLQGVEQLIPVTDLGDGFNRIASIVMEINRVRDGIVLIDEIENGLHYSVHGDVWKAIAEAAEQFNVQIFATTHSREMIRAAHRAFKERDEYDLKLIRLDRSQKTGQIVPAFYDEETLEGSVQLDYEVR